MSKTIAIEFLKAQQLLSKNIQFMMGEENKKQIIEPSRERFAKYMYHRAMDERIASVLELLEKGEPK